jgi:two-component system, cell cycle response regulator CtrA
VRVLLVDDDAAIARSIELMLKIEEINVYRTDLGEEGVDLGKIYDYDIILLDLNLPDISGYEVLRSLRSAKVVTPVLILSGLANIEDKIRGLGLGADDYLSKPFHKDELIARIHALVRRSKGHAQSVIAIGDLIVNLEARNVELRGQKLHLTAKEYQIPRTPGPPHRLNFDQGNVPQSSLRRIGRRTGRQDHRRLHMQAQKEAR